MHTVLNTIMIQSTLVIVHFQVMFSRYCQQYYLRPEYHMSRSKISSSAKYWFVLMVTMISIVTITFAMAPSVRTSILLSNVVIIKTNNSTPVLMTLHCSSTQYRWSSFDSMMLCTFLISPMIILRNYNRRTHLNVTFGITQNCCHHHWLYNKFIIHHPS